MTSCYFRPFVRHDSPRPIHALPVAGGPGWFTKAARHDRDGTITVVGLDDIPEITRHRLSAPRLSIAGVSWEKPRVMGILNVTPDSFSDGGHFNITTRAVSHAHIMMEDGADILDIGGESTRPGAQTVPKEAEIARIEPVVRAVSLEVAAPISIDTRKSSVAQIAVNNGASMVNDVSGFTHDPMLAHYCARNGIPVCVMHARGDPETMQDNPHYDDVLLDVYDFLEAQILMLEDMGISRDQIVIDPGIGFGKKIHHNLTILKNVAIYHGLGCPILIGASRKGFIGRISGANPANERMPGSVAVALAAVAQGVQIVRVHDVKETVQALALWDAIREGAYNDA